MILTFICECMVLTVIQQGVGLALKAVSFGYEEEKVLKNIDFSLPQNAITALIGPNGSGKSTLLKLLAGQTQAQVGQVLLKGQDIRNIGHRRFAQTVGYLAQNPALPGGVNVRQLVEYGRYPYHGIWFGRLTAQDHEIVDWALEVTGCAPFCGSDLATLSGGQRQRAWIALSLAQKTDILLLDEPCSFLDVRYQNELLALIVELNRLHGLTICWVLHDLNHAVQFSDHIAVLQDGVLVREAAAQNALDCNLIRDVFGWEAQGLAHPQTGKTYFLPAFSDQSLRGERRVS